MPTYEFKCCDNQVSVWSSMTDSTKIQTPQCGNCLAPMKRVYSFGNVQFKGAGFYTNDRKET